MPNPLSFAVTPPGSIALGGVLLPGQSISGSVTITCSGPAVISAHIADADSAGFAVAGIASYQLVKEPPPETAGELPRGKIVPPRPTFDWEVDKQVSGGGPLEVKASEQAVISVKFTAPAVLSRDTFKANLVIEAPGWTTLKIPVTVDAFGLQSIPQTKNVRISQGGTRDLHLKITSLAGPATDVTYTLWPDVTGISMRPTTVHVDRGATVDAAVSLAAANDAPLRTVSVSLVESAFGDRQRDSAIQFNLTVEARRRPTLAIVLSGGGAKGDFEIGALRYIYDYVLPAMGSSQPDVVCGTSVGAINAVKLAEGGTAPLAQLEQLWLGLNNYLDMYKTEPVFDEIGQIPGIGMELKQDVPYTFIPVVNIIGAFEVKDDLERLQKIADDLGRARSLLNLSPIEAKMRSPQNLDPGKVARSGVKLRMATVSLESGNLLYVTETGNLLPARDRTMIGPGPDARPVDLASGVLASASIPVVFPPVMLQTTGVHESYVDGGVRTQTPIQPALDEGVDRVIVLNDSQPSVDYQSDAAQSLDKIALRATNNLLPNEIGWRELNPPHGLDTNVTVIQPRFEVHDTFTIDPGLVRIGMDYGWIRTADVLENSVPVTSLPLQVLLNNADDIIRLRLKIWATEFAFSPWQLYRAAVHGYFDLEPPRLHWKAMPRPLFESFGSSPNNPTTLFAAQSTRIKECIPLLRRMKRDLLALLAERRKHGGRLHPDSQRWVQNWERHPWPNYWATPWGAIDLPNRRNIDGSQIQDLIAVDQKAGDNVLTRPGPPDAPVGAEPAPVLDLSAPAR